MRVAWHLSLIPAVLAVFAASPLVQAADAHHGALTPRRHALNRNANTVEKRAQYDNARFTNFAVGQGACGGWNVASDFVIALSIPMYEGGPHCGESVTLTYNGKTAHATVVDECQECPYDAIDLSNGLFEYLVPGGLDVGQVYGSWSFGSGDPAPPPKTQAPPPPPKTTPPPPPPPSSTQHSSTHTIPTSTPTPTSTPPKSTPSKTPSSTPSTSATPTVTSTPAPAYTPGTFDDITQAFLGLGALAVMD